MTVTVDDLTGYVECDLDADLARFLPDRPDRPDRPDLDFAEVRPIQPFLRRLPDAAAASLAAFDRKVRSAPRQSQPRPSPAVPTRLPTASRSGDAPATPFALLTSRTHHKDEPGPHPYGPSDE